MKTFLKLVGTILLFIFLVLGSGCQEKVRFFPAHYCLVTSSQTVCKFDNLYACSVAQHDLMQRGEKTMCIIDTDK